MTDGWIRPDWPIDVVALATTRAGGVSKGGFASLNLAAHVGDAADAVAENRRRLTAGLELEREPVWLEQVHGSTVVDASLPVAGPADASFTTRPGVACVVMTADCLPVLFSTLDGTAVAAAHAGWRGLAAGVLENTLAALPGAPRDVVAWLGPAISQPAFEVGDEVRDVFVRHSPDAAGAFVRNARGRWQADLYELAALRLKAAGLRTVYRGDFCTYADAGRFFSYRRDPDCGRMATLIAIPERGRGHV